MKFFSQNKGIIISVILIVAVFIGYGMIKPSDSSKKSGLELTVVNSNPAGGIANAQDPSSALVLQLLTIQNIVFDTKFFEDPVYRELVDQSRPLGEREVGRPNPFLRIGIDGATPPPVPASSTAGFIQSGTQTPAPATNSRR